MIGSFPFEIDRMDAFPESLLNLNDRRRVEFSPMQTI